MQEHLLSEERRFFVWLKPIRKANPESENL